MDTIALAWNRRGKKRKMFFADGHTLSRIIVLWRGSKTPLTRFIVFAVLCIFTFPPLKLDDLARKLKFCSSILPMSNKMHFESTFCVPEEFFSFFNKKKADKRKPVTDIPLDCRPCLCGPQFQRFKNKNNYIIGLVLFLGCYKSN